MKKQYKRKKYDFGTQEVVVPEKGNAGDVGQNAMALGATGATLGSVAGPWGTVIGGAVGALAGTGIGLAKANEKTRLHNQAMGTNNYIRTMNRTSNQGLETFQAKKGLDLSKYPDGSSGIQLQPDELAQLDSLKSNPQAYKQAMWNMIGYAPKKYPAGSDGWKQQSDMYNSAVNYVNQGFRPFTKEKNGKIVSGYTKMYEDGTNDIETSDGIKPIEVEKDELVFSRSGKNYKLKADFKGGKTHEEGGEPYIASEGDVIYPGKHRGKVMSAYKRGDFAALESMRLNLPKDKPNPINMYGNKGIDPYKTTQQFNPDGTPNLYSMQVEQPASQTPTDNTYGQSLNLEGYKGTNFAGTEGPNGLAKTGEVTPSFNKPVKTNSGAGVNAAAGLVQAAPTIYNTMRGTFAKAQQPARRFYNPTKYNYTDLSDPNRRLAQEQNTVDKYNAGTVAGSRGQVQSYLSQAGINNYKRQADINNFEIGRHSEVNNMNTQLENQAKGTNLQLANEYDNQALQNEAKRTEYLGKGVEGASALGYNREMTNNLKQRDNTLASLAKTQHYGYEDGIGTGYYTPEGDFISGGKTYKKVNGKLVQYRQGTSYIRTK